jgi:hypothetical protein
VTESKGRGILDPPLSRGTTSFVMVRCATEAALLRGLRNQASVANIVSDSIALRLQPSLGHGTFDKVPLNPFAFRAGKGSQVLARRAWFDGRQLHRRTACPALRTLVLCVEHRRSLSWAL